MADFEDIPDELFIGPSIEDYANYSSDYKFVDPLLEKLEKQYLPLKVEPLLALMMADECPFCNTSEHLNGVICCPPMYSQLSAYGRLSLIENESGESKKYDTVCRKCRGKRLVDKPGQVCYECYSAEMDKLAKEEFDYCMKNDVEYKDPNVYRYMNELKAR